MKLRKKHKEQTELHVGPLNDILFILLFFFLLASLFSTLNAIKVNLPKGKSDTKVAQRFVVSADSTGIIEFENKRINLDNLPQVLQARYLEDTTVKSIVFNGDLSANYGDFVKVLVIANKMGLKLAVNTKEE
jgi:biopolymer transport protein ExbD